MTNKIKFEEEKNQSYSILQQNIQDESTNQNKSIKQEQIGKSQSQAVIKQFSNIQQIDNQGKLQHLAYRNTDKIINNRKDSQFQAVDKSGNKSQVYQNLYQDKKLSIKTDKNSQHSNFQKSQHDLKQGKNDMLNLSEIECDIIEEEISEDNNQSGKNINNSKINQFSVFKLSTAKDQREYSINKSSNFANRESLPLKQNTLVDSQINIEFKSARQNPYGKQIANASPELNNNFEAPGKRMIVQNNPYSNKKQSSISSPISSAQKSNFSISALQNNLSIHDPILSNSQSITNQNQQKVQNGFSNQAIPFKNNSNSKDKQPLSKSPETHKQLTQNMNNNQLSPDQIKQQAKQTLNKSISKDQLSELRRSSSQAMMDVETTIMKSNQQKITSPQTQLVGTDIAIQIQFFTQILMQKEEELREQKLKLKQTSHKLKQKQHRFNKMSFMLRDTKADNRDIENALSQVLIGKLIGRDVVQEKAKIVQQSQYLSVQSNNNKRRNQ
eukprot:403372087